MTVDGDTVCKLIQTFPMLLILAHSNNRCLHTHLIYKHPTTTPSTEYYHALDSLFQTLFPNKYNCHGNYGKPHSYGRSNNYNEYSGYGTPCYTGYETGHGYGTDYGHGHTTSHGNGYNYGNGYNLGNGYILGNGYNLGNGHNSGHSYSAGSYGNSYNTGLYGNGYPVYKKVYKVSSAVDSGSAPNKVVNINHNKYKLVVKRPRHHRRRKYQQLEEITCKSFNDATGTCMELKYCPEYDKHKPTNVNSDEDVSRENVDCVSNSTHSMVCCPDYETNIEPTEMTKENITPPSYSQEEITESFTKSAEIHEDQKSFTDEQKSTKELLCEILGIKVCQTGNTGIKNDLAMSAIIKANIEEVLKLSTKFNKKDTNLLGVPEATEDLITKEILTENTLPRPPHCGFVNSFNNHEDSMLEEVPWMVLLGYKTLSGSAWMCGGSIITKSHILTAAHCVNGYEKVLFEVKIGVLNGIRKETTIIPIKQTVTHPQYDRGSHTNDVAILTLLYNIEITDKIKPVCLPLLPEFRSRRLMKYKAYIVSWRNQTKVDSKPFSFAINQIALLSSESSCRKTYPGRIVDSRIICAGMGRGGKQLCYKDNGSPLMVPMTNDDNITIFYQIGLLSYGKKCAESPIPGVYTRITHFLPWIKAVVE